MKHAAIVKPHFSDADFNFFFFASYDLDNERKKNL